MSMKAAQIGVDVLRPHELTESHVARWRQIVADDPDRLGSPFFHPAYVQSLAAFRDNVEVAVLLDGPRPLGFFPFERHGGCVARPPGLSLCDFHGVIAPATLTFSPARLLRGAELTVWHFDDLPVEQSPGPLHLVGVEPSPYMDLSAGFEEYVGARRRAGSRQIPQIQRKRRKLERELGPLEFRWHDPDDDAFESLIAWKRQQRARTGTVDVLEWDWARRFVSELRGVDRDGFAGVLSTLRVRGRLAAVHLGVASPHAMHWWIPTYNPEFARYSAGTILLCWLAGESAERGMRRLDLGKGEERYKSAFASGSVQVATGSADVLPLRGTVRRTLRVLVRRIKASPMGTPTRHLRRWVRNRLIARHLDARA